MFRAVKPNVSADEEKRLRALFKLYKSYKVDITISSIQVAGSDAKVRVSRQDTIDGNAIRLQQLAEPNTLLLSDATARRVQGDMTLTVGGPVHIVLGEQNDQQSHSAYTIHGQRL